MSSDMPIRGRWPVVVGVVLAGVVGSSIFASEMSPPVRIAALIAVGVGAGLLAGIAFRIVAAVRERRAGNSSPS